MDIIRISPNPSASHPTRSELNEADLGGNPLELFLSWYNEAKSRPDIIDANAMHLSTVSAAGAPTGRIVLLREIIDGGFVFYTNTLSQKGRALESSAQAALTFFWDPLRRQVRIEGTVAKVSDAHADEYFSKRPRGSQIGAWASEQSAPLQSRALLGEQIASYEKSFAGVTVPRPKYWSGYRVIPERFEFWQERADRLHDRFEFIPSAAEWRVQRLYP